MNECANLATCGFFQKYLATHQAACQGLITQYCKGPRQDACKRKDYKRKHGTPPPDDMLPVGVMFRPN
ncbi:MAG TPA: hypothetical protein VGD81_05420 [Opitutaceae bacterium]